MTIQLPENLESSIREAVHSGQFPSLDDAMAEAARLLLSQLKQGPVGAATHRRGAARHRS
jgi:Arc/MetJ-type ribon-helix-helix transcriptional regulator